MRYSYRSFIGSPNNSIHIILYHCLISCKARSIVNRPILALTSFILLAFVVACGSAKIGSIDADQGKTGLSASMQRYIEQWQGLEAHENEFFSSFSYFALSGLSYEPGVSRRDPSTIIKVGDQYHLYYTRSTVNAAPVGYKHANQDLPATTWDMSAIYHATSHDGKAWEEQGVAVKPGPQGEFDDRSVFTPDILVYNGRYYLYYQAVRFPYTERSRNVIGMSWADSPEGPWHRHPDPILKPGKSGEWVEGSLRRAHIKTYGDFDSHKVHDPNLLIRNGQIWMYYKAHPMGLGSERKPPAGVELKKPYPNFSMGLAIADKPEGPFVKHSMNPVSASGHEAVIWPFKNGVAALITANGPEKNTVQWAEDGINFNVKAHVVMPPDAAGVYCPDKFTNTTVGEGFTWGISHVPQSKVKPWAHLIGFKCDLSSIANDAKHKRENIRYDEHARFNSTRR